MVTIAGLRDRLRPAHYVVPTEGSQFWEDDWAIAAVTRRPDLAHAFLNFVLRPDIAAQEAAYTCYATGSQAALRLLDPSLRDNASIYPPDDVIRKLEPGMPLDPEGSHRRKLLWAEVRGGK